MPRMSVQIAVLLSFTMTMVPQPSRAGVAAGIRAVTRPSADITLSFVRPGRVALVPFNEGDVVQADQVLVRQDDTAEQILLTQLKAQAEDTTQIQAAAASLAQKKVDLAKLEKAAASNAATTLEVEHARLDVTIAELSHTLAEFEHKQAVLKYQEQEAQIKHMQLRSPIDGRIEKIDVEVGESVNALAEAVRVVKTDPLWIDAPVPLQETLKLKPGMAARLQIVGKETSSETMEGRVIFVGAVADAASGTLRVRIEVPNQSGRPAGEHVLVSF